MSFMSPTGRGVKEQNYELPTPIIRRDTKEEPRFDEKEWVKEERGEGEVVKKKVKRVAAHETLRFTPYALPKPQFSVSSSEGTASKSISSVQEQLAPPPYIVCNEGLQDAVLDDLRNRQMPAGGHIGFSGWFNYDIMAATRPKIAVICDINPRMHKFYHVFSETLKTSTTPVEFLEQLQNTLAAKKDYFDNGFLDLLPSEASRENSWLATQSSFEFVRQMHLEERVIYRYMDAAASQQEFEEIQKHFGDIAVATVYASNIYEWLENDTEKRRNAFKGNMGSLMCATSLFIDAYYPHISARHRMVIRDGFGPPLRVTTGKLPAFVRALRKV